MGAAAKRSRGEKSAVKPKRQIGSPRPMWGFRPTASVQAYLEAMPGERSANIVELLDLVVHLRDGLGVDFWEVERLAKVEGTSTGAVLARLVKASLAAKGRK